MYKKLILTAALTAATVSAFAGGYVTNTNQKWHSSETLHRTLSSAYRAHISTLPARHS